MAYLMVQVILVMENVVPVMMILMKVPVTVQATHQMNVVYVVVTTQVVLIV